MIQHQSLLKVADNSGAKTVKCIKVLGGYKRKLAYSGNVIIVSVQNLRNKFKSTSKVKKGDVYSAVILRLKKKAVRKDGSTLVTNENSVALINKLNQPLSTRVFGPISKELRGQKFMKIASLSPGFI